MNKLFDHFGARAPLPGHDNLYYYRLDKLNHLANIDRLPFSIKVMLEALLRTCDGYEVMPMSGMLCQENWARNLEWGLRKELYEYEVLRDDRILVVVRDSGIGMSENELARIQHRLLDGKSTVARTNGLLNTYERLNLMFGELLVFDIDSTENEGTTITMEFPARYEDRPTV